MKLSSKLIRRAKHKRSSREMMACQTTIRRTIANKSCEILISFRSILGSYEHSFVPRDLTFLYRTGAHPAWLIECQDTLPATFALIPVTRFSYYMILFRSFSFVFRNGASCNVTNVYVFQAGFARFDRHTQAHLGKYRCLSRIKKE